MSTPSSSENSLLFPATQPSANLNPELVLLSAFIFGKKPPDEPVYVTRLSPDTRIPDWEAISRQRMQLDFPLETSINVWKLDQFVPLESVNTAPPPRTDATLIKHVEELYITLVDHVLLHNPGEDLDRQRFQPMRELFTIDSHLI